MAARTLVIAPDVRRALAARVPVVALETAVVTHGLPRTPFERAPKCASDWNTAAPANLALAQLLSKTVRASGAVPASIGMLKGQLVVGLSAEQLEELAALPNPRKLSARDLGPATADGASGGTTVAATLVACAIAGIRVFATGGIGGVHRNWTSRPDVSADLHALARSPVAVISAGAKSILDLPATVEMLDTLGIPVLGMGTPYFPRFTTAGDDTLRVQVQVSDAAHAAAICTAHWEFNPGTGVLVANPPPAECALPHHDLEAATLAAERAAHAAGIGGAALTPFLLEHVARTTQGRSVEANIGLLNSNARLGAELAAELVSNTPKA
jgi:pseudouridine-5'-phosphate glycosidase